MIRFQYFKYESRFAVSFRCNLILMYFFKVISFHLEISYVIIQCLRTVILVDICSDLACLQSKWFSTDVLRKFSGNGHRRRSFSISSYPTSDVVATSHLGLIWVKMPRTVLRRHHDVATGTLMRPTYLRRLCDVSLVRSSNRPI